MEYTDFNSAIPLDFCMSNVINFLSIVLAVENLAETSPKEDYVNAWLQKQITSLMVKIVQRVYAYKFAESCEQPNTITG